MPGVDASPAVGGMLAGWRLLRLIGQGSDGAVYLAEGGHGDPQRPDRVALKLVSLRAPGAHAEREQAFLRNAETGLRLQHPDIVRLYAAGIEGELGWLAMEAVPGTDLGRYTEPRRLLPDALVLRLIERLARALAYAHGQGVVHRDLKPANVLVHWPTDTVKLADLGLARGDDALRTGTGIVPGTPAYMAPEQLAGRPPTPASDFYALGVMLFQLLCGRLPHEAASMGELLHAVATAPAPDLRQLRPAAPPALAALLARLLDKRPAARAAGGEALAGELQALRAAMPAIP